MLACDVCAKGIQKEKSNDLKEFLNLQNISEYPFVHQDHNYIYLYKHVRFSNGSLAILKDGTIRFTPPAEFNDPFDCVYGISEDHFHSATELRSIIQKGGLPKVSPAKRILLARQVKHVQKKEMDDLSYFRKLHENFGVCCLNHNPLNILMWSHYAENHTGFLIEFKFSKKELQEGLELLNFLPIPVQYLSSIPIVSKVDRKNLESPAITNKVYLSKAIDWEYEKEFRILKHEIKNPIQKFPKEKLLCTVISGIKIEDSNKKLLKKICEEQKIPFYVAERIPNGYGINVPNHPRLDLLGLKRNK
ncbi:DUF2971 domain-containing protein [Acinetobacter thermotolerans]|uniref:DUF2971 domain-containing protein n=1 Tax=Acinetobacter thermotolerans TaxID=3151487 RepID=UPI00325A46E4